MSTSDKTACDLYGSAHLLRLMVKMKSLLNETNLIMSQDNEEVATMEKCLEDLLEFLDTNRMKYFTSKNYVEVSEDYVKLLPQS